MSYRLIGRGECWKPRLLARITVILDTHSVGNLPRSQPMYAPISISAYPKPAF